MVRFKATSVIVFMFAFVASDIAVGKTTDKAVSFKIDGILREARQQSTKSKFCYVECAFKNNRNAAILVPFRYSNLRPEPTETYVLSPVTKDDSLNAAGFATVTCEWRTISGKKACGSVCEILDQTLSLKPFETGKCLIAVSEPEMNGLYIMHLHFDNNMIFEHTKMLADFASCNPQFFEGDDEVQVLIK